MPIYGYCCEKHGSFDVWQNMNDEHTAVCSYCGKKADRVFYPIPAHGDLPTKPVTLGKTRGELLDNMATEGFYSKGWRATDEVGKKQYTDKGWREKPMVGWTPELG
jgi:putative FmdB family regulatory protein